MRFVWGRIKHATFWLNIKLKPQLSVFRLSFAGQATAFLALISSIFSEVPGVSPAQAAEVSQNPTVVQASFVSFNATSLFVVLALVLLALSNLVMWRQRKTVPISAAPESVDAPEIASEKVPAQTPTLDLDRSSKPNTIQLNAAGSMDLERQCQKLAAIASQAQRYNLDTDLNNRVREEQLARICHDLRTPLNAVIGFSDLMQREMYGPLGHDKYIEYVQHIGDSGHNLLSAVDDIFELSSELDELPDLRGALGSTMINDIHSTEE